MKNLYYLQLYCLSKKYLPTLYSKLVYIKWVKTSWTDSIQDSIVSNGKKIWYSTLILIPVEPGTGAPWLEPGNQGSIGLSDCQGFCSNFSGEFSEPEIYPGAAAVGWIRRFLKHVSGFLIGLDPDPV